MRKVKVLASTGVVAVLLVACTGPQEEVTQEEPATIVAPIQALQGFYDQRIQWASCSDNEGVLTYMDGKGSEREFSCATVSVPLDYDNVDGATIDLQLVRYSVAKNGTPLVFNPGGPGGSAVSALPTMIDYTFTDELLQKYDIVAVDPRGVGLSAPVQCLTAEEIDRARAKDLPTTVEGIRETARELGASCLSRSPEMAKHSDSDSAMRDLDIVRAAFGQEKLDYVGFSYGTFLGALYADAFPKQVGRFVLDGAVDPAISVDEVSEGQAIGFENVIDVWMERGAKNGLIPLKGTTDEMKIQLREWLDSLKEHPLQTADPQRPLTKSLATAALLGLMYDDATWSIAWAALSQAMTEDDGSMLLQVADFLADREPDGTYKTNSFDAFNVVNGLDYEAADDETMTTYAERILANSPLLGQEFAFSSAAIAGWPVEQRNTRKEVSGKGADPILVIGTTFDPATPYWWAESLANQLESATLLKVNGFKHTAYSKEAGECVISAVDGFLLGGTVPQEGTSCTLPTP